MITYISTFIVLLFAGIIIGAAVVLLLVTPKAAKDVKKIVDQRKAKSKMDNRPDKGMTSLMEEMLYTRDLDALERLVNKLYNEIEKIESQTDSKVQLRKTEIIKKWLDAFSPEQHAIDLKKKGVSQQIEFDNSKKDFKLTILKK